MFNPETGEKAGNPERHHLHVRRLADIGHADLRGRVRNDSRDRGDRVHLGRDEQRGVAHDQQRRQR